MSVVTGGRRSVVTVSLLLSSFWPRPLPDHQHGSVPVPVWNGIWTSESDSDVVDTPSPPPSSPVFPEPHHPLAAEGGREGGRGGREGREGGRGGRVKTIMKHRVYSVCATHDYVHVLCMTVQIAYYNDKWIEEK